MGDAGPGGHGRRGLEGVGGRRDRQRAQGLTFLDQATAGNSPVARDGRSVLTSVGELGVEVGAVAEARHLSCP